ncbi:MAG TPA: protein translocase subunit SecF [Candidatus Competibacteraceae bacterium]|nr:protein translocase subunit SecF [Candidatus Competibacteraceae bacterium]
MNKTTQIDFMGKGKLALIMSFVVLMICVISLASRGMNLGLDFTGGTVIELSYPQAANLDQIRQTLGEAGFAGAQAQNFGTAREVLVRVAPHAGMDSAAISSRILQALQAKDPGVEMRRVEFVGSVVGGELIEDGALAALFAILGILVYVALRFEWKLALGTIAATVHDVVFTVGVFSVLGIEFDLTVLAAVLAVIGYSVNDTVVVLDRIRENFRRLRKENTFQVMNISINETLSRTLMTSLTTLIAVVVLFFLGGPAIHNFALAMIIGIVIGTYSSIYIASAGAYFLGLTREDLLPKVKEVDERP